MRTSFRHSEQQSNVSEWPQAWPLLRLPEESLAQRLERGQPVLVLEAVPEQGRPARGLGTRKYC